MYKDTEKNHRVMPVLFEAMAKIGYFCALAD